MSVSLRILSDAWTLCCPQTWARVLLLWDPRFREPSSSFTPLLAWQPTPNRRLCFGYQGLWNSLPQRLALTSRIVSCFFLRSVLLKVNHTTGVHKNKPEVGILRGVEFDRSKNYFFGNFLKLEIRRKRQPTSCCRFPLYNIEHVPLLLQVAVSAKWDLNIYLAHLSTLLTFIQVSFELRHTIKNISISRLSQMIHMKVFQKV